MDEIIGRNFQCPKCGGMVTTGTCQNCRPGVVYDGQMNCITCHGRFAVAHITGGYCHECFKKYKLAKMRGRQVPTSELPEVLQELIAERATLRAVYDRAFDAAQVGLCANIKYLSPVDMIRDADAVALDSVRTHAARMSALDDVIAKLEATNESV